jgi:hypothetical protein
MVTLRDSLSRRSWFIYRRSAGAKTDYRSGLQGRQASSDGEPGDPDRRVMDHDFRSAV